MTLRGILDRLERPMTPRKPNGGSRTPSKPLYRRARVKPLLTVGKRPLYRFAGEALARLVPSPLSDFIHEQSAPVRFDSEFGGEV